jgi:apolipoprotein D and lipocalin family protein
MPPSAACLLLVLTIGGAAQAQAQPGLRAVPSVDLRKFAGTYHEIARLPQADDLCAADVTSRFAIRPDGGLDVVDRCRKADGTPGEVQRIAKAAGGPGNAMWRVRVGPLWQSPLRRAWREFWILAVGPEYGYTVIGDPARRTLRILSRLPSMPPLEYQQALEMVKGNGYDPGRLVMTPQGSRPSRREATAHGRAPARSGSSLPPPQARTTSTPVHPSTR